MRLSIVIPTRRPDLAKRCIDSISEHTDDFEIILVDHEGGLNEKINWGMRAAKGDYIALLHDDIEVTAGWADELADVGAFKIGEMNDTITCWGGIGSGYCTDPGTTPDYSAFLVLSRRAYADIGQTDEFYKEPGHQDTDYGRQIKAAGYSIKCLPGKIIHHPARTAPLSAENERYFREKWL